MDVLTHRPLSSSSASYSNYNQSIPSISRTSSAAAFPPGWRAQARNSVSSRGHIPSRSGASPVPTLTRSATTSLSRQESKSKTPISDEVLRMASNMDNPKARDLAYLVEDAKVLHKKLTVLETEGIDLQKVGLFSAETLASFKPPPPPIKKRPRGIAYENVVSTKGDRNRKASSVGSSSPVSTTPTHGTRKAQSLPRSSISSVGSPTLGRAKSKSRRSIFSSFSRAKGKRSSEELSNSMNGPRHSVSSLAIHKPDGKAGSLNHLAGVGIASYLSQGDSVMNRSSSLDVISFDSPSAKSLSTRSSHLASPLESSKSVYKANDTSGRNGTAQQNGNGKLKSHGSSTLASSYVSHSFKKSWARQSSVDRLLEDSDSGSLPPRRSVAVSDYGSYPVASATPPLHQTGLGSKPITRHSSADGILQPTDTGHSPQGYSGVESSRSSQSIGSQENLVRDSWSIPSTSPSPSSSPMSQELFLKPTPSKSNGGSRSEERAVRSATCSPGWEKPNHGSSTSSRSKQRKVSAGALSSQHDFSESSGKGAKLRGFGGSASLPQTPRHVSKNPESKGSLLSQDLSSVGLSCPDSASSSRDSLTAHKANENSSNSSGMNSRITVATLVDELTEVEKQVQGTVADDAFSSTSPSRDDGASKRAQITASSATLELDQLMQNLEDFEPPAPAPNSRDREAKKPKSAMDDLSNMLGSLEMDMENIHGVSTVAKGMCAACKKPILAKVLDALGRQWHPEHFTCASCDTELAHVTYYESNGRPYCEKDFHELFAPRCAYCNGAILERVMRALDKTWHPEHFFCTLCGKSFGSEGFHEKDNKAYCRECYYEKYAPRCRRCSKAIMEGFITALNAQWHPECFSCKVCGITFPRGNYFEHEGEPHCELHYHASRGTLCASCQTPVTGKCVTAMGRKWHPEHFTCAFCLKLLNKGTFKEHRHNPYCQTCYIKLFG